MSAKCKVNYKNTIFFPQEPTFYDLNIYLNLKVTKMLTNSNTLPRHRYKDMNGLKKERIIERIIIYVGDV